MTVISCGSSPTQATTPSPPIKVAIGQTGDTKITIAPTTYSASDPCASVTQTIAAGLAPAACQSQWLPYQTTKIPGQDVVDSLPMTRTVSVAQGFSAAAATADGNAFFRSQALSWWAVEQDSTPLLEAMYSSKFLAQDGPYQAINNGGYIASVPACQQASGLRVANVGPTASNYIATQGWNSPSSVAIVATYPTCGGITVAYQGGVSKVQFAESVASSAVFTGSIKNVAGVGNIWSIDGVAFCGATQLKDVCGN